MADNHIENEQDPSASTQMFRAFVAEGETDTAAPKSGNRTVLIVAAVLLVVAVVAALLVF
jgi:hypothetical protein